MSQDDKNIGRTIAGRYECVELLGEGGMGTVYRARHLAMKRDVALKLLKKEISEDPELMARFQREMEATSTIDSPHTVTVFDYGHTETGEGFLVMELLKGRSLREYLDRRGAFSIDRLIRIIRQIALALDAAHNANVIHRDIKPGNVLLLQNYGDGDWVKVLDFGIAYIDPKADQEGSLTDKGIVLGSTRYLSPERIQGFDYDGRSDLYSLGVLTYELATGKTPFVAQDPMVVLNMHVNEPAPSLGRDSDEAFPVWLDALVADLLAKDPDDRPQSASDVIDLIDTVGLQSSTHNGLVSAEPLRGASPPAPAAEPPPIRPPTPVDLGAAPPPVAPSTPQGNSVFRWMLVITLLIGLGLVASEFLPQSTGRSGHPAQQLAAEVTESKKPLETSRGENPVAPRRMLSAILFTDMVGYSTMMSTDETEALKTLEAHNRLMAKAVKEHGGKLVKNMGDGYLVTFQSALKAVKAALSAQKALEVYNQTATQQLKVRMGVTIGDVIIANGELVGETINVAADIERRSKGGDVIVTEIVFQQVRRKVLATAQDLGRYTPKSKAESLTLYSLKPASTLLDRAPAAALSPSQQEVAENEQNAAKNAEKFKKACDSGDLLQCLELAFLHANGTGVERDATQAFALYAKACDGGNARGCYFAALKYSTGVGIKRDAAQAKRLFDKACAAGHQDACGRSR